jgi:chloramphenicol O-acetyltransferase type A
MRKKIALNSWNRQDHFRFFSSFEEPFFGVTFELNCTSAYHLAKKNRESFFLRYLHASLRAANAIEAFRYRIENDEVWVYDTINASPTINRPDGTFGFAYMDYHSDFKVFSALAQLEVDRVKTTSGLQPSGSSDNVIHFSALPWLYFTAISHARRFSFKDSCPKITFGKCMTVGSEKLMPVSVHVHHALVDGHQVGLFAQAFQHEIDNFL